MELLLEYEGLKLIKKYGGYYIRFIGGQSEEYPCDLAILEEEAIEIIANNETIKVVRDSYKSKVLWTKNYFVDSYLKAFMQKECQMSEKCMSLALDKLNRHKDIKMELYESLIYESFPRSGAIKVCGYSAQDLNRTTHLSVLGSYNYLIYLREDEVNALKNLKAGLARK